MKTDNRYEVYYWDKDTIAAYDETFGEGSFDSDSQHSGCYNVISDWGTLVASTDDVHEAMKIMDKTVDKYRSSAEVAIWDGQEQCWFS